MDGLKNLYMKTILSIDGGGIRGILPARILQEMRRRLDEHGDNRPFHEMFDLIAGTSTGALIALGLVSIDKEGRERFSASDIVDLYKIRGKEIFPPTAMHSLRTAIQAFRYKYSPEIYERLLYDFFGDTTIQDAATNLIITSFDTEAMEPHCIKKRDKHKDAYADHNYYMRDAARASSAAPTFFPPARISPIGLGDKKYSLIDGAVFANNPAGLAYVEAQKIFPEEKEFVILSLGTGDFKQGYSYEEVHAWGYMEWVNPMKNFPIGSIMAAGQSEAVNHQLRRISNVKFFRINIEISGSGFSIDDAGQKNMQSLLGYADQMIKQHDSEISAVCRLLNDR